MRQCSAFAPANYRQITQRWTCCRAERALSNYFLFEHVQTDQKFEKFRSQTEEEVAAAHDVLTKQAASAAGVDDEVDTLDMTEVSAHEAEMGTDAPVYGDGSDRGSQEGESEEGSDFAAPWDADDDDEVAVSPGDSEVDSLFDDGDDGDHEEYGLLVDESDSDSDFSDSEADVESDGAGVR